jgi:hypothetical protein
MPKVNIVPIHRNHNPLQLKIPQGKERTGKASSGASSPLIAANFFAKKWRDQSDVPPGLALDKFQNTLKFHG